ncbi:MAG TPA: LacI family DNA-binding transcriptional regulator [Propionibacteriaceae bacterium]|nr:LacI family DNA-binding transcriptional regulator [Propionibacteriaceae bacterium]
MATMRQVAQRAGVSAKTVSRVMNNDRYVSDDVRLRVERAIEDLQYVPNLLARTFRYGRDAAIGIAVPDISDPFFSAVIHAVEEIARDRGVALFVTSVGTDGTYEQIGVEALLGRQIVGLISTPVAADQSYLMRWRSRTAIVFIDRAPSNITADTVVEDDHGGGYAATAHLIEHGHRRIGFIGDSSSIATTAGRLNGYNAALADAGIVENQRFVSLGAMSSGEAAEATRNLLSQRDAPTALFSSNARCSIGVVPALQESDRTDIALVGYGDFPLASALRPALTVIDQNPDALGKAAGRRLFQRLDNPAGRWKRRMVLPVQLLLRDSCAASGGHQTLAIADHATS